MTLISSEIPIESKTYNNPLSSKKRKNDLMFSILGRDLLAVLLTTLTACGKLSNHFPELWFTMILLQEMCVYVSKKQLKKDTMIT